MRRSGWTKWLIVIPAMLGIYLPADCNFGIGLWSANCDAGTE